MMKPILYFFVAISLSCFAAKEEVTASFQSNVSMGPNVPLAIGSQLTVEDNLNTYMILNPGYSSVFTNFSNMAIVKLRYDDQLKYDPAYAWTLTVSYHTEFTDLAGNVTSSPISGYNLSITYLQHSAPANYTDISINTHTNPNSYKVKVVIDNLAFKPGSAPVQNTIPAGFGDIYMDVTESTERYYVITSSPPAMNVQSGFLISNTLGDASKRLPLAWTYATGAESYDLEWLFIGVGNNHYTPGAGYNFDFKNATRINTLFNHYEIPLAYPAGIVLYRVRAVGYDVVSGDLVRHEGPWSYVMDHGNTADDAPSINAAYRYDYAGLDLNRNWLYNSSFAEEGKRKEMITYTDEALKDRQMTAYSSTDNQVVITEPVYDYEGRIAADIAPTPTLSQGMRYYNFNPAYNPIDFDANSTLLNPNAFPSTSGAGYFYSSANTSPPGMYGDYIPNAQGYPYMRTRYTTDGTTRVRAQSALGATHRPGNGHEVNYIYAKPTQMELDRMFGNEVGWSRNYAKTGQIDENGQSEVTYYDNHQRVIATCLAGNAPANLLEIDHKPASVPLTVNMLAESNDINTSKQLVSSSLLGVVAATTYHLDYDLQQSLFCKHCDDYSICKTCRYDLTIRITDETGMLVGGSSISNFISSLPPDNLPNPIHYTDIAQVNVSFDVALLPGTYSIDKILEVNETSAENATQQFINDQLLDPSCFQYPVINPQPCNVSCFSACEEHYKRYDYATGSDYYVDDDEHPVSISQGTLLVQQCAQSCEAPKLDEKAGQCAMQLLALKQDMSPGGQYFSNTMAQFTVDPVVGVISNPAYPSLEFNWLSTNLASSAPSIFSALSTIAGVPISSWAGVKANFQEAFLDVLIKYHPEFCAYNYFCNGAMLCGGQGTVTPADTIKIASSNSFDYAISQQSQAYALAHGSFNTPSVTINATHATSDFLGGNSSYCTYTASANPADKDPFIRNGCNVNLPRCSMSTRNYLSTQLSNFLPLGTGGYFSIWYVLDDPDNIHLIPVASATTPAQAIIDVFKQLHGDGTSTNPGLFATTSKWEFYRGIYLFYKQLFIYNYYTQSACPSPSTLNPLPPMPTTLSITHSAPTIHYPANPIFGQIIAGMPTGICNPINGSTVIASSFTNVAGNLVAGTCSANCTDAAEGWLQQLAGCGLTPTQTTNIQFYLIEVCKKECSATNITGSSGCTIATNPTCQAVTGPGGALFYNFSDVINYFTTGACTVNIMYPPNTSEAGCACASLDAFALAQGLSTSDATGIATALNNTFGSTSYSSTDVLNWKLACAQPGATVADLTAVNFPNSLKCNYLKSGYNDVECSCQKINAFINQIGYDATNPADYPAIVAAINNYFALPAGTQMNVAQLTAVLNDCANSVVPAFDMNNVPGILLCPAPASSSPDDILEAQELAACQLQNLLTATSNAVLVYHGMQVAMAADFKNDYKLFCLNSAKNGAEKFIQQYSLNEYMVTLYYYDQAGNLVKTVPPEGFQELSTPAQFQAVADYRAGITSVPYYPVHRMITRFRYDSYENKVDDESPDQGLVKYWYDSKGRIVLSQTARQKFNTPVAAYSESEYDNLNRPLLTRQVQNNTAITYDDATNPATLSSWLGAIAGFDQITRMYYDAPVLPLSSSPFGSGGQKNLRNRVSHVTFELINDGNTATYEHATHYSYDIHGIPAVVAHENNYRDGSAALIFPAAQRYHTSEYKYDLISGNVNEVVYQRGKTDALHHRFEYDANNRLTKVHSSSDGMIWENDASYFYYAHGPLARKELGDKDIQGCDYAYTIRNWIKGMNSSILSSAIDIGKDGLNAVGNLNALFATDGFGYTNGYFKQDYTAIKSALMLPANYFEANVFSSSNQFGNFLVGTSPPHDFGLFNGNISHCAQNSQIGTGTMGTWGKAYRYDSRYRLKLNETFRDASLPSNNFWAPTAVANNTRENFVYDFNGNMETATLTVNTGIMDNLAYDYLLDVNGEKINNKLYGIHDSGVPGVSAEDLENQSSVPPASSSNPDTDPAVNYGYNQNGDLQRDQSTGIQTILYDARGKVREIIRDPAFTLPSGGFPNDMEFFYDVYGRRVVKIEKPRILSGSQSIVAPAIEWRYTIYAYDGKGEVAAIYTLRRNPSAVMELRISERYVSGQGRVAQLNRENLLSVVPPTSHFERNLGLKTIELTAVTDNVNTTLADYKISGGTSGTTVNFYRPLVLSAIDYFSYGSAIPIAARNFVNRPYRYGVNAGSEKDPEIMNANNLLTTYYRELDTRTGRWWSVDPVFSANESPYVINNDNPINVTDPMGDAGNPLYSSTTANAGPSRKFIFRKDDEGGWVASLGLKCQMKHVTTSVNFSLRKYSAGLGAPDGETQYDFVVSPAVTLGTGKGPPSELNLFNGYSVSGVDDEYAYSLTLGANLVYNRNRPQYENAISFRVRQFKAAIYEDLRVIYENKDRWWTGGGHVGWNTAGGKHSDLGLVTIGTDVFTGDRILKNKDGETPGSRYHTYTGKDGRKYFTQADPTLVNGVTYLSLSGKKKKFSISGNVWNPMWSQDAIHKHIRDQPFFESKAEFEYKKTTYKFKR